MYAERRRSVVEASDRSLDAVRLGLQLLVHYCDLVIAVEHVGPGVELLIDELKACRRPIPVQKSVDDRNFSHASGLHSKSH